MNPTGAATSDHLAVLDGWRGISILCVLAAHLLPLGPKSLQLNGMVAAMGMAIFFTLSGFLITRFLLAHANIVDFLIRRFARIVPLAWLAMAITLPLVNAPASSYLPNFFFYANLPPIRLTDAGSHLWSLCVEVQFYVGVALLVLLAKQRGLYLLPLLCVAVTTIRVVNGAHISIVTWLRVDEILVGATLALAHAGKLGQRPIWLLSRLNTPVLIVLLAIASHPAGSFMSYLRPYTAALLVGATLCRAPGVIGLLLRGRVLAYIAEISYALYVIHQLLAFTWLGSGEGLAKYLKRPLLLATTFALAHLSTFQYEHRCIAVGKRLSARLVLKRTLSADG